MGCQKLVSWARKKKKSFLGAVELILALEKDHDRCSVPDQMLPWPWGTPQWGARCVSSRVLLARWDSTLDYFTWQGQQFPLLFIHNVPRITGVNSHLPDHSARSAYESSEHFQILGKYCSKSRTRVTSLWLLITALGDVNVITRLCFQGHKVKCQKLGQLGTSPVVQWLRLYTPNSGGPDLTLGQGIISCFLLLKDPTCCN